MKLADQLRFCFDALREQRLRAGLSILSISIGVGAVILLTSIGEGARLFVISEFQQFGTNILEVHPGKTETFGIPGVMGGTTHKLTFEDAEALRRVHGVDSVVPVVTGLARVSAGNRGRSVYVLGVNHEASSLWKVGVVQGSFLPAEADRNSTPITVLGPRLKQELFGDENAIGAWVRIAGWRLRVIGVAEPKGRIFGFDMDDLAYVPTRSAMGMFDIDEMTEIDLTFRHEVSAATVVAGLSEVLRERHAGKEDFTILTQAAILEVFDDVLRIITAGVGAIAAISLLVGAVGILTMMWISVGERTQEIGLVRALGATMGQVQTLFLFEAAGLALVGGLCGLLLGLGSAHALGLLLPGLPVSTPPIYAAMALFVSAVTGLVFGWAPARRAARFDPVRALRAE